jgi:hypothetical protein
MCNWVAARAQGKPATKPDPSVSYPWFVREHIKKVSGTILGDGDTKGEHEVIAYGYRRHCILSTTTTEFKTTGGFTLWVQELPEVRDVTVNSGESEKWVELEESELGKDIVDLAHTYGIEAEALAKDLMVEIARFVPYSELKGDYPDASAPVAVTGTAISTATTTSTATSITTTTSVPPRPAVDPEAKTKARSECIRSCVAGCKDDAACELDCPTKKCPK